MESYKGLIDKTAIAIDRLMKTHKWEDDEVVLSTYELFYEMIYNQVYNYLVPKQSSEGEAEIREILSKYVIGRARTNGGRVYLGVFAPIQSKLQKIEKKDSISLEIKSRYLDLYDNFLALASFRSFMHFALYIEKHLTEYDEIGGVDGDTRIINNTLPLFTGWYYYATKMVLDGDVKFICKQMPTSYGKSYGDVLLISFIFGYNINNDVIKVFGNPYNCDGCIISICEIMSRKEYAKVFPYYAQFNCEEKQIFEKLNSREGTFKIAGSKKPVNFLCVGKDSKISGVRGKYIFLDDITQAEDMNAINRHKNDIHTYNTVWKKRTYGKDNCFFVVGGTAYSIYDLLSHLKSRFGFDNSKTSKINKYTKVAKSDGIITGGISVFITVPKLDYKTDKSTYPAQFDTYTARMERKQDYETFMAMEQQLPVPPKNTPFYFTNLREYEKLPEIGKDGREDYCYATLDGKRKGSDFCAMPICTKIGDDFYLVDAVYDNKPMEDCYTSIVNKIIQRKIKRLLVESNINEGLPALLTAMLHEQGYYDCKIEEIYNYDKKDDRISTSEAKMKSKIIYPKFGLYAPSHPLGMALEELYTYSYEKKNAHDDFTDALANFAKHFASERRDTGADFFVFSR